MRHVFVLHGQAIEAALTGLPHVRLLLVEDRSHKVALVGNTDGTAILRIDSAMHTVQVARQGDRFYIHMNGDTHEIDLFDPVSVHAGAATREGDLVVRAPMPGKVVAIPINVGDGVRAGQTLVVIESMKLELTLRAECAARVVEITIATGQVFDKDTILVRLAAPEAG